SLMAELSDAVIALPGGAGTLDELFELLTWKQLGLHRKPMGLLDVASYWQPLMAFLEHAVDERFLMAEHLETLIVSHDAGALLDLLASHQHRTIDKWLDRAAEDRAAG
ncbi:MAG TPA: LOG family protein, partial [Solirubrobacteraceae bacterium]|nr:LOG family protein [Solirubrobacteraceae bacterium]